MKDCQALGGKLALRSVGSGTRRASFVSRVDGLLPLPTERQHKIISKQEQDGPSWTTGPWHVVAEGQSAHDHSLAA